MKKYQLISQLLLFIIVSLYTSAYSWIFDAGEPLYADAVASYDSVSGWTDGPISVCTGWMVYFKAQGPGGTEPASYDIDYFDGEVELDEIEYGWNWGDGNHSSGTAVSHIYNEFGLYYSILTVDDKALYKDNCTDDTPALDTVCVYVCSIENPHIGDANLEKDLTYRLPYAGTFTFGTSGWACSTTGVSTLISYTGATEGWVGLKCYSQGGAVTLSFPSNFNVNMADPSTLMDEIKVFVKYRLNYPNYNVIPNGSSLEILLYGDTTTHNNLPIALRKDFHNQSFTQTALGFREDSFCVTAIPPDFHQISNMVLRYTGGTGEASELQIDQIYLSVSRVQP